MPFHFKKFSVEQNRTAMKVGTDGVLLGAWTSLENNPQTILDIGAGTGLIALMLAQRSDAFQIDAVEVEENAYQQCVENFENSPWNDRLFCFHASLQKLAADPERDLYDLIVSNPPFFQPNPKFSSPEEERTIARQYETLPFEELLESVRNLLAENGIFCVIIPFESEEKFIVLAQTYDLFPSKITRVKGSLETPVKRSLLQFSFEKKEIAQSELIIETSRQQYTEEYKKLVCDFYLKM